eukprot:3653966-Amphidinium_carterae.2
MAGASSTVAGNDFNVVQSATVVRHTHNDGSTTTRATMPPLPPQPKQQPMETQRDNEPQSDQAVQEEQKVTSSATSSQKFNNPARGNGLDIKGHLRPDNGEERQQALQLVDGADTSTIRAVQHTICQSTRSFWQSTRGETLATMTHTTMNCRCI